MPPILMSSHITSLSLSFHICKKKVRASTSSMVSGLHETVTESPWQIVVAQQILTISLLVQNGLHLVGAQ